MIANRENEFYEIKREVVTANRNKVGHLCACNSIIA